MWCARLEGLLAACDFCHCGQFVHARQASADLSAAHNTLGHDWKPSGSVLEGDVQHRMYSESGFFNVFEQQRDGSRDLALAYAPLDAYLGRLQ